MLCFGCYVIVQFEGELIFWNLLVFKHTSRRLFIMLCIGCYVIVQFEGELVF
jgi:hypothetical protein